MKAKSFIVALVAVVVAVMVAAVMATNAKSAENQAWVCYSHFQDAPTAMSVSRFKSLTTALQPELGGKPYWTIGFIPFANANPANGQAVGNGHYLHCNLTGTLITPLRWVNNEGVVLTSSHYRAAVFELGTGATDPAGNAAVFNLYPVVSG